MKRIVMLFCITLLLFSFAGCSNTPTLPSGHGYVQLDYNNSLYNRLYNNTVDFQYVNETTVKIILEGKVYYIPTSNIEWIRVD